MKVQRVLFHNRPLLELDDDDKWTLHRVFIVKVFYAGGNEIPKWVAVPIGFRTDLASVPRLPGVYLLFGDRARRAAIVHDWLYQQGGSRQEADAIFYAAMRHEADGWTRKAMWLGVRAFGWLFFNRGRSDAPAVAADAGE